VRILLQQILKLVIRVSDGVCHAMSYRYMVLRHREPSAMERHWPCNELCRALNRTSDSRGAIRMDQNCTVIAMRDDHRMASLSLSRLGWAWRRRGRGNMM